MSERETYYELIDTVREFSAQAAHWHRVAGWLVVALGIVAGIAVYLAVM